MVTGADVKKVFLVELEEDLKRTTIAKVLICLVVDDVCLAGTPQSANCRLKGGFQAYM